MRFQGHGLSSASALPEGIGYCLRGFHGSGGRAVVEELILSQFALGASAAQAKEEAWSSLERVGACRCAQLRPYELDSAEAVKCSIARAQVLELPQRSIL
jgi:ABC-type ATPase involved in cell division